MSSTTSSHIVWTDTPEYLARPHSASRRAKSESRGNAYLGSVDRRILEFTAWFGFLTSAEIRQLVSGPESTVYRHISLLEDIGLIEESDGLLAISRNGLKSASLSGYTGRNPAERNPQLVKAFLSVKKMLSDEYLVKTRRQAKAEGISVPQCDLVALLPDGKDIYYFIDDGSARPYRIRDRVDAGITVLSVRAPQLRKKGIQVVPL